MDTYYIAVDGGGSKTEFCVYNCKSHEVSNFFSGSSNYKIVPNTEKENILEGIRNIFSKQNIVPAQVRGLVMGMSGCDSPEDHKHYLDIAASTEIAQDSIYICNDSELAFYSKGMPPGLCIIAGTGSVATGIAADGRKARSGGWGSGISDEGSGGWLGLHVLRDMIRNCDGYAPYQTVFANLKKHFNAKSFDDVPRVLSGISIQEIAGIAKLVMDLADDGEEYCLGYVQQAADHVAEVAASVCKKLEFRNEAAVDVVMAGSLFKSTSFQKRFIHSLKNQVDYDNMRFCDEVRSPVSGGIALAKIMFGKQDPLDLAIEETQIN